MKIEGKYATVATFLNLFARLSGKKTTPMLHATAISNIFIINRGVSLTGSNGACIKK